MSRSLSACLSAIVTTASSLQSAVLHKILLPHVVEQSTIAPNLERYSFC